MTGKRLLLLAVSTLLSSLQVFAGGPSFHPDTTFTGSSLAGWHTVGGAQWRAENGELIGTPKQGGGWLMLDRAYQDIGVFMQFRCTGGCETGVLLRAEKTPTGMRGVYVALSDPDLPSYAVTLDAQGQMVERTKLRHGGGLVRIAPPPSDTPEREFHPPVSTAKLPFELPDSRLRPDDWNAVEILFDANIVRTFLNNGREHGAVGDEGYGPIALYVGGSGEVRFKDLGYKDLGVKIRLPEKISPDFRKQQLSDFYYSYSSAAADFNHDGVLDVVSGPYIYYGPDYTKSREIYLGETVNPSTKFAGDAWMQFAADVTGDGWPDVLTVTYGGPNSGVYLYVNPQGEDRRWDKYKVVSGVQSEIAVLRDVDGDGKPEVVYMGDGQVRYAKPDPANPTGQWIIHNVSEKGYGTAHGIGVGDINGDGRMDIVNAYGWWEQPPAGSNQEHGPIIRRSSPGSAAALWVAA